MLLTLVLAAVALVASVGYMAFTARLSGGGYFAPLLDKKGKEKGIMPYNLTWLPELFFTLPFGLTALWMYGEWWQGLLAWAGAYIFMQSGHGTAYHMGFYPQEALKIDPKTGQRRVQKLSMIVDPICKLFKKPLGGFWYCSLFMGLKGFLIAASVPVAALILAVLWPVGYYYGWKLHNNVKGEVEHYSGAGAGLALWFACLLHFLMIS